MIFRSKRATHIEDCILSLFALISVHKRSSTIIAVSGHRVRRGTVDLRLRRIRQIATWLRRDIQRTHPAGLRPHCDHACRHRSHVAEALQRQAAPGRVRLGADRGRNRCSIPGSIEISETRSLPQLSVFGVVQEYPSHLLIAEVSCFQILHVLLPFPMAYRTSRTQSRWIIRLDS